MAAVADHERKAGQNLALADSLAAGGHCEWAITVLFYAAVHHAGGLLDRDAIDSTLLDHQQREYKLDQRDAAIMARYKSLSGMSRRCRYLPNHQESQASFRRARKHVEFIADYCRRVHAGLVPGR